MPEFKLSKDSTISDLRARVARIDRKYAAVPEPRPQSKAAQRYIEEWLSGQEVETALGRHFETEKLYEAHRRHGSADIGALFDLPHDLLDALSEGSIRSVAPRECAFLDIETSGTAGNACAFLVGVGRIVREGFRVRQFFMRDFSEEPSVLDAVAKHLASFRVLITYNGRAFDQPVLDARYRFHRVRDPFGSLEHLDFMHGARHLWKLRFESCRLVDLENQVLGFERQGDMPGALIPYIYFEYLRTRRAARLLPVFQHNATDILTLACFTGIVPYAFKDPVNAELRHGAEMAGLARWLSQAGDFDRARALLRRAVDMGLPDGLLFRALWDLSLLERKLGREDAASGIWNDLAECRNPYRLRALEELAKYYEHVVKDRARALEITRAALAMEDSPALRRREARLVNRRSTAKRRRLL